MKKRTARTAKTKKRQPRKVRVRQPKLYVPRWGMAVTVSELIRRQGAAASAPGAYTRPLQQWGERE